MLAQLQAVLKLVVSEVRAEVNEVALLQTLVGPVLSGASAALDIQAVIGNAVAIFPDPDTRPLIVRELTALEARLS